jgi:hypothetical protein
MRWTLPEPMRSVKTEPNERDQITLVGMRGNRGDREADVRTRNRALSPGILVRFVGAEGFEPSLGTV